MLSEGANSIMVTLTNKSPEEPGPSSANLRLLQPIQWTWLRCHSLEPSSPKMNILLGSIDCPCCSCHKSSFFHCIGAVCTQSSVTVKMVVGNRCMMECHFLETVLGLKQEMDELKKSNGQLIESPPLSTMLVCAKGHCPNPTKTAPKNGININGSLMTDQADDIFDFLDWKQLPKDVHDRMKAQENKLTVQTSSSLTQFRNHLTVELDAQGKTQQREWNFVSFVPTS